VPVVNDLIAEPDETFTVTLINPVNGTIGTAVGTGVIEDDDAEPVIVISSPTVIESGGSVDFIVTLEDGLGNPYPYFRTVTVDYASSDGSAVNLFEYLATAGTLTFVPGDTSETITVLVVDDLIDEFDEAFNMTLSNPVYATIDGAFNPGIATITDDDSPMISVNDPSRLENATPLTFQVTLDQPSPYTITVDYVTAAGTATETAACAAGDYNARTGTVTFAPGQVSRM
jgi:chitinase